MAKLSILGAGPAGLFAGYFARGHGLDFDIYEASGLVGGNCRTIRHGEFAFDSGAHRFHDKDPEMTAELMSFMADEIEEIHAPSYIFHNQRLLHFPLTPLDLLTKLPATELGRALLALLRAKSGGGAEPTNFREYSYRRYGQVIADLFLSNYSEKLWGVPTDQLSTSVAGSRLKELNLKSMLTELLFPKRKAKHLEGSFFYPRDGFGRIAERVREVCGAERVHLNSRVTRIEHDGRRIQGFEVNGERRIPADVMVSSLPLSVLARAMTPAVPAEVTALLNAVTFRHVKLVALFLDRPSVNGAATLYFPDLRYTFCRVYEPRNRSVRMSPRGRTSLVAEVPFGTGSRVAGLTDEQLLAEVRTQLETTGLFAPHEVIGGAVEVLPFAYPVLEAGYEEKVEAIHRYFDGFENLYLTGRNGKFVYSWTPNMMHSGLAIVDDIVAARRAARDEAPGQATMAAN
jgi:protoporphyrinogen oxidase